MKKEKYEIPQVEIISFETEDIITTSGGELPPPSNPSNFEVIEGEIKIW